MVFWRFLPRWPVSPRVDIVGYEADPLWAFGYLSTPTAPFSDRDLSDLLLSARRFNSARQVTGKLLVLEEGVEITQFAQWIEGPRDRLASCIERIRADPRHTDFEVVHDGPVEARRFPYWDMAVEPATGTAFEAAAVDLATAEE